MTDQQILNRLKSILGSLYDPDKEDMYLRVIRKVLELKPMINLPLFSSSLSQRSDIGTFTYLDMKYSLRGS